MDWPTPPPRPTGGHKGTFGSVLIVGGSRGMAGAISLSGQAALHSGAGLVTVAVPDCIADVVAHFHPAYMTLPLNCDGKHLDAYAAEQIEANMLGKSALGIGPGLGQSEAVRSVVHRIYRECKQPLVLDADGLNAFAGCEELLQSGGKVRVLTPHPGEFARLTRRRISEVQENRESLAREFAQAYRVILLLKGERTVITDGERLLLNPTGCDALATGGSGDVLTGLVVGLLGQQIDAFDATRLAAWLHGLAGEAAAAKYSAEFVSALEILEGLSNAWKHMHSKAGNP